MVDPRLMCDRHLLGEHGELHKFKPSFVKHHSIAGRVWPEVQIEPEAMAARHNALASEMLARGMNHRSPYVMPDLSYLPEGDRRAKVNQVQSIVDLYYRCEACRMRMN